MNILRNEARIAYIKLIFEAKSKSKERNVDLNGYYEIHHIFPKSIYPEYVSNKHNLIKLTKKEIQDYVRTNSGGLLYEPYHKGEFRVKNPVKNYGFQSEPVIDVKDKYITYPINIDFDGKTWNTDWSSEYHINYHILPEKMVYEIINNIILALKDCIVESKKMDIEKDFING